VPIRALIVDDDATVRRALADVAASDPQVEVVGMASDATEGVRRARELKPDVALVDVRMPGGGGPAATKGMLKLDRPPRVLAVSAIPSSDAVIGMLRAGAVGFIVKGAPAEEIRHAIRRARRGESTLSPSAANRLIGAVVHRIEDSEEEAWVDRVEIEDRIRAAIRGEGLSAAFQPIFDLEDHRVSGYEALARFSAEPERGPLGWFADAQEVGLGLELELATLRTALTEFAGHLNRLSEDAFLSLNASPTTLLSDGFAGTVNGALPPERVVVEVTEHAEIADYAAFHRGASRLRSGGIRLAIDDVGAGYASLQHILHLEPDFIKLDLSLTQGIESHRWRRAMAAALISFARQIDCSVVAEGIETGEELRALIELGAPCGQGYHLAKPGPL
jgi:EAL domain-containing protein (putative c-di-GMP-specific phosphodiesterase class I)/CheY-like chemotaxis protein